ncbi:hypothetical protein B0H67DRAFT_555695 [Lasiosphaeris hirsuta]|uniref:Peptidase M10 metallopeptidase domain-containing protein n=1 Tax=Lasiosphaeris hirsuta TaxID=260670 RepID=A0AA40A9I2_9PEZI|nr:hypothetical protein B0H67DRAFT_555695 [Lasiosphaeris hirsuta]
MHVVDGPQCPTPTKGRLFRCSTQDDGNSERILLAQAGRRCDDGNLRLPRWKPFSLITFTLLDESFDTQSEARRVDDAVTDAVRDWNRFLKTFGIQFQRVARDDERPLFFIAYITREQNEQREQNDPNYHKTAVQKYAKAFFPDSAPRKRRLRVYADALSVSNTHLANIMRHEFGHILGLRHDNAAKDEDYNPSVRLLPPNPHSIMTSLVPEDSTGIQISDVEALNTLYALEDGSNFENFTVATIDPVPVPLYMPRSERTRETLRDEIGSVASTEALAAPPAPVRNTTNPGLVLVCFCLFIYATAKIRVNMAYPP